MVKWLRIAPRPAQPSILNRFPQFPDLSSAEAAARLHKLSVLLIGLGSVGTGIAFHLARCGVGRLLLVDPGEFVADNLFTSPITPSAIGLGKAQHAGELCAQINPNLGIRTTRHVVQELDAADFAEADLVVASTDNLAAELSVAEMCLRVSKPLIHAAVSGEHLVAQVRCCSSVGQCLACGFGHEDWSQATMTATRSCSGGSSSYGAETRSPSSLCGLASDLAALCLLRHVLQLGTPVLDHEFEYAGFPHRSTMSKLKPNRGCRLAPHSAWEVCRAPQLLSDQSLKVLAALAGFAPSATLCFSVSDRVGVRRHVCDSCRHVLSRQFVRRDDPVCPLCGCPLHIDPLESFRIVTGDHVNLDATLSTLGVPKARSVVVAADDRTALVIGADS